MLPFNSVFHIKLLLSPLFLKKTNALGAAPPSASATLTVCHCEKALLPFVLVKLEESCHKSKTEQFGGFFLYCRVCGIVVHEECADWKPVGTWPASPAI